MNYDEMSTDHLIDEIVLKAKGPLPGYNYQEKCYVSMIRLPADKIKPGMKITEMFHGQRHNTFREACVRILEHFNAQQSKNDSDGGNTEKEGKKGLGLKAQLEEKKAGSE